MVDVSQNKENRLLNIAKNIVIVPDGKEEKRNDSVNYTTIMISKLSDDDFQMLKSWFEQISGHELKIPQNVLEMIDCLANYLESNGVKVPKLPSYETEQYNSSTSADFFNSWNSDDMFSSRKSR